MKNAVLIYCLFSIFLISCAENKEVSKQFSCNFKGYTNIKIQKDYKNLFSMELPNTWKTGLYFDDFQSKIYSADTTQQLTKSFIVHATFTKSALDINDVFYRKVDSVLAVNQLTKILEKNLSINGQEAFLYRATGMRRGFEYHQLNVFMKKSSSEFLKFETEFYGTEAVEERICKSISLLETLKYLE